MCVWGGGCVYVMRGGAMRGRHTRAIQKPTQTHSKHLHIPHNIHTTQVQHKRYNTNTPWSQCHWGECCVLGTLCNPQGSNPVCVGVCIECVYRVGVCVGVGVCGCLCILWVGVYSMCESVYVVCRCVSARMYIFVHHSHPPITPCHNHTPRPPPPPHPPNTPEVE